MSHHKPFALVVQKKEGNPFEIIFRHHRRGRVLEEEIKSNFNSTFIAQLFMDTAVYENAWIKKFNADRNHNIKWNKENGL